MSGTQKFDQNSARNIAGGKTPTASATPAKTEDKAKYEKVSPDTLNKLSGGKGTSTSAAPAKTDSKVEKISSDTLNKFSGGQGGIQVGESAGVGKVTAKPIGATKVDAKALGTLSGGKGTSTSATPAKADAKTEKLSADTLNKFSGGKGDNPTQHKSGIDKSVTGATGKIPEKFEAKDLSKIAGGFSANEQKVKTEVKPVANKQSPLTGGSANLIK